MAIYEILKDEIRPIVETTFAAAGISERGDLQRLLRSKIDVICPDTLIIAEEFGEWEDSRRRIDLLGIDKGANLVVFELKRTEDGGHMELQAIRYAAMISTMTFEKVVDVFNAYLRRNGQEADAKESLLSFLEWTEPDEEQFAQDVRIVLASAEFSKELTTAVMWLNNRNVDISCVRIRPYKDGDRILIDVQQVIPLPEAAEYQVHIKEKERQERQAQAERYGLRKRFWISLLKNAREQSDLHANISPSEYSWIGAGSGMRGVTFNYSITKHDAAVDLYIDRGTNSDAENKAIFDELANFKQDIELKFGGRLEWEKLEERRACRLRKSITEGGYRSPEEKWPAIQAAMIDAMCRLEKAVRPYISRLRAMQMPSTDGDGVQELVSEPSA